MDWVKLNLLGVFGWIPFRFWSTLIRFHWCFFATPLCSTLFSKYVYRAYVARFFSQVRHFPVSRSELSQSWLVAYYEYRMTFIFIFISILYLLKSKNEQWLQIAALFATNCISNWIGLATNRMELYATMNERGELAMIDIYPVCW